MNWNVVEEDQSRLDARIQKATAGNKSEQLSYGLKSQTIIFNSMDTEYDKM